MDMSDEKDHALADAPDVVEALAGALAPVALTAERRAALRTRVIASASADEAPPLMEVRLAEEGAWVALLPRVSLKALRVDAVAGTHTSLWRLDPGARIPAHDHHGEEECLIVSGSVLFEGRVYREGDYLLARPGLRHAEFESPDGAVLLIRGELTPHLAAVFSR